MRGRPPISKQTHRTYQQHICACVAEYLADHGYPPSRREIVDAVPGLSLGVLADELERLALDGRIEVSRGVARGIVLVAREPARALARTDAGRAVGRGARWR